jgi:hypothetical protein
MYRLLIVLLVVTLAACGGQVADPEAANEAPPGTDIHLYDLSDGGASHVTHITDRQGYDNQPFFTPDGSTVLFTSDRTGNMDTFAYSVLDGSTRQVTTTEEGEYSPTVTPNSPPSFSAIRMDLNQVQELWQYPLHGSGAASQVAMIDRVGYHTWVGSDRVLFFRLGRPATLQLVTVGTADTTIVAENVGRSLHRVPGRRASAYMISLTDDSRELRMYDWDSGESEAFAVPIEGGQDFALAPDGSVLMAVDGVLYRFAPGQMADWEQVAELGLAGTTRLSVSPDGTLLVVVAVQERWSGFTHAGSGARQPTAPGTLRLEMATR